jgi:hypothetical protein
MSCSCTAGSSTAPAGRGVRRAHSGRLPPRRRAEPDPVPGGRRRRHPAGHRQPGRPGRPGRPLLRRRGDHRGRPAREGRVPGIRLRIRAGQGRVGQHAHRRVPGRRAAAADPAAPGRLLRPRRTLRQVVARHPAAVRGQAVRHAGRRAGARRNWTASLDGPWTAPRRRLGRAAGSACCPISTPASSWVSPGIACTGHGRRPRSPGGPGQNYRSCWSTAWSAGCGIRGAPGAERPVLSFTDPPCHGLRVVGGSASGPYAHLPAGGEGGRVFRQPPAVPGLLRHRPRERPAPKKPCRIRLARYDLPTTFCRRSSPWAMSLPDWSVKSTRHSCWVRPWLRAVASTFTRPAVTGRRKWVVLVRPTAT